MENPQIRFELVSPNHEFRARITGGADRHTANVVMELAGIGAAWAEDDGSMLYLNVASGFEWSTVRPDVVDAIKRAKDWSGEVTVLGF